MDRSKREVLENSIGKRLRVDEIQNAVNQIGESKLERITSTRRDFIKISAALGMSGINMIFNGCAATPDFNEVVDGEKITYPKLPDKKIPSPENYGLSGCYTGAYMPYSQKIQGGNHE